MSFPELVAEMVQGDLEAVQREAAGGRVYHEAAE